MFSHFVYILQDLIFKIFVCPQCPEMKGLLDMFPEQNPADLKNAVCIHSKITSELMHNYQEVWDLDLESPRDVRHSFSYNNQNEFKVCLEKDKGVDHTLAGVQVSGKHNLLYTTGKQQFPRCTGCASIKCKCYVAFKSFIEKRNNDEESDSDNDTNTNEDSPEASRNKVNHYDDEIDHREYKRKYGYNKTPILYPFKRCKKQQQYLFLVFRLWPYSQ